MRSKIILAANSSNHGSNVKMQTYISSFSISDLQLVLILECQQVPQEYITRPAMHYPLIFIQHCHLQPPNHHQFHLLLFLHHRLCSKRIYTKLTFSPIAQIHINKNLNPNLPCKSQGTSKFLVLEQYQTMFYLYQIERTCATKSTLS